MSDTDKPLCVITGVGPGTGSALVRRFAEDYRVIMIARDAERLAALSAEIPGSTALLCDVGDTQALDNTIAEIQSFGNPEVFIHNAVELVNHFTESLTELEQVLCIETTEAIVIPWCSVAAHVDVHSLCFCLNRL